MNKLSKFLILSGLAFSSSFALAHVKVNCPKVKRIQHANFDTIKNMRGTNYFTASTSLAKAYGTSSEWYVIGFGLENKSLDNANSKLNNITELRSYDQRYILSNGKTIETCVYISDKVKNFVVIASSHKFKQ